MDNDLNQEELPLEDPNTEDPDNQDLSDEGEDSGIDEAASAPDDNYEEYDLDGKKYNLPRDLKPYIMRHSDYTQKTMTLAEERRALEAARENFTKENETKTKDFDNIVKLKILDENIKQYEQVNWAQLSENDPVRWQTLFSQYTQLKDAKNSLAAELHNRKQELDRERERETAKLIADNRAIVERDISGWTPAREKQVKDFAVANYGLSAEEVTGIYDARLLKMLNDAYIGKHLSKAKLQSVKGADKSIRPVTALKSGATPGKKDPGRMSDAEYLIWRKSGKR